MQLNSTDVDKITASIYPMARKCSPDELIEWCFDQLGNAFATRTMMWRIAVPLSTKSPSAGSPRAGDTLSKDDFRIEHCGIRSLQDPVRLSTEYAPIEHSHPLMASIFANPAKGYTFDTLSDTALNSAFCDPNFVQFSRRNNIPKSLAIALPVLRTSNLNILILWRRQVDSSFTSVDIDHLERLAAHFIQGLQHSRTFTINSRLLEFWDKHNAVMTLNESGFLVDIDERFESVIDQKWPESSGSNLPKELKTLLEPDSPRTFRKDDILFNRYSIDAHRVVVATELGTLANLTQRELEISILFARGEDHKAIASNINRSSSTVRNHLRNIYHKLGIKSRSELAERLQRLTSMPQ